MQLKIANPFQNLKSVCIKFKFIVVCLLFYLAICWIDDFLRDQIDNLNCFFANTYIVQPASRIRKRVHVYLYCALAANY